MCGWLYLIKNGDLHKIGITKNIDKRMRQLKPDSIVIKLYSRDFRLLEREFHKRYKNVRIPQTEYFRLDHKQIREIKKRISKLYYPNSITLGIFFSSISFLLFIFLFVFLFISLTINDINKILIYSLLSMEKISFCLSFFSLFFKSYKYLSFLNELKFRSSRLFILLLCSYFFRFAYSLLLE